MEKFFKSLEETTLFRGIIDEDIKKIFDCISVRERKVKKNSFVFHAGDEVRSVYLIVSGSMFILSEDYWGNRSIIETMHKNVLFGEAYVFAPYAFHIVSVAAAEDSVILEINPEQLFNACLKNCDCHLQVVKNTNRLLAKKIVMLTEKVEHIMNRTLREKILSYLSKCAQRERSNSFEITYTRQGLADYLSVDRSSLSHELSRLQKEGLIKYRKNRFELLVKHDEM